MSEAGTSVAAAAAGTGTADAAAVAAAAAATSKPWYDGADDDTKGYLQNRGWDKVDAKTAAFNAAKAHREAEKLLGIPADKIVRLPKDANDVEGTAAFRAKLGVPADPKDYDFSKVKFADGTEIGTAFKDTLSAALSKANVSKDGAPDIASAVVKFMETAETTNAGESAAKLAIAKDALKANWGNNFNANMIVAQNAFKALGMPVEAAQALEATAGYDKVMEMFRNIGARIGEDTFVRSTAPGQTGSMSKEQATAALNEKLNDSLWADKLSKGDTATAREFDTLTRLMQ